MKILLNQSNAHQSGIYVIKTNTGSKVYVGSTRDFAIRANNHKASLKVGKHSNRILQNHVNKYGLDDLTFEPIYLCGIENLIIEEQRFIDELIPKLNIKQASGSGAPLGSAHGKSKLTEDVVRMIKQYLSAGNTCKVIAESYNVSRECIMDIKKGRTWKHV